MPIDGWLLKEPGMRVHLSETPLPILREADIAVVGGSFAGIAAALRFSRAGLPVIVIEPRTYLGREMTATLRPWLAPGTWSDPDHLPAPIKNILNAHDLPDIPLGSELPLHPDTVKRCLEDALIAAGIGLLYASLATELCEGGLVIGNKSGRQVIHCGTIIDATESALVARLAGGAFAPSPNGPVRMWRTLEFDRVQPIAVATLPVPPHLGIADNVIRLHGGYRGAGHVLIECGFDLPYRPGLEGSAAAEFEARRRTMQLVAFLVSQYPELAAGRFAGSSHELHGRWSSSLTGPSPRWASHAGDALITVADDERTLSASTANLAGPVPNLWCLSEAARLDAPQAAWFRDPIAASRIGECFAGSLLALSGNPDAAIGSGDSEVRISPATNTDDLLCLDAGELESPQRGRRYKRRAVESTTVPVHRSAQVLVVGGGSSGATAAITAAREGMHTVLIDMNPGPGGTGTYGGVDSYWYGRHVGFAAQLEAAVAAEHVSIHHTGGKWNIDAKTWVLLRMANDAGVESIFNAFAIAALMEGDRVRGVIVATRWGVIAVLAEVVIDATGDGDIAAFAGATFTYGAERTHSVMWYSLAQYASPGLVRNNFTSTVAVSNVEDTTRAILAGRRRGDSTHDHGIYVATRESRHIRGGVTMTLTDQLRYRRWPDVINIHYSNHDIKGQTESEWLRSGLIPPNLEIEIPYRLVLPEGIDGLLVAGKAISVTHDGLPAVRMQADLENLGGVVALAAAEVVRAHTTPRNIELPGLQRRLVDEGMLPGEVLTRVLDEREHTDEDLEAFIAQLTGDTPLYSYSDMHMGELFRERLPFVEICSSGDRVVPMLERALANANGPRRLVLAQALAICGSTAGVPVLVDAIASAITGGLPERASNIRHAGFPPDQGAMPDVAYLLFSLGMVPDERALPVWERVVTLLAPTPESLRDRFSGTFSYVDAVCHAADRSASPAMIPLLEHLHAYASLRDQVCREGFQPDFFKERQAMLELGIVRALARCGSNQGFIVLIAYLDDVRALLAERAHSELIDLTGVDHGKDAAAWTAWLKRDRSPGTGAHPAAAVPLPA